MSVERTCAVETGDHVETHAWAVTVGAEPCVLVDGIGLAGVGKQSPHHTSVIGQVAGFGGERCEEVGERVVEGGYALVFQCEAHVGHDNTDSA